MCAVACTYACVETFQWTTKYNSRLWSFFATLHLRLCFDIALDPYALITCEGRTVRTPTINGTSDPNWNSGALFFVRRPKKTHLLIQVRSWACYLPNIDSMSHEVSSLRSTQLQNHACMVLIHVTYVIIDMKYPLNIFLSLMKIFTIVPSHYFDANCGFVNG